MTSKIHIARVQYPVCSNCGSPDVRADAYAQWDHAAREWVVLNTFDKGAYCDVCDGETRIDWCKGNPPGYSAPPDALDP